MYVIPKLTLLLSRLRPVTGKLQNTPGPGWLPQLLVLLLYGLLYTDADAGIPQPIRISYHIPHITSAPKIDGVIGKDEWAAAERVDLTNETSPSQNIPALVTTEALMMEDGANFYVAFIAQDPDPKQIRAFYKDRDTISGEDLVGVVLDTYNDERRAYEFFVNPLGVQMDRINDDVVRRVDASWNAIWDSAGRINGHGYTVEMKIPLNQLRFTAGKDKQVWGIDLVRHYPRDKNHQLSNNTDDYSVSCYLCQLKKAEGFSRLQEHVNLRLGPDCHRVLFRRSSLTGDRQPLATGL